MSQPTRTGCSQYRTVVPNARRNRTPADRRIESLAEHPAVQDATLDTSHLFHISSTLFRFTNSSRSVNLPFHPGLIRRGDARSSVHQLGHQELLP